MNHLAPLRMLGAAADTTGLGAACCSGVTSPELRLAPLPCLWLARDIQTGAAATRSQGQRQGVGGRQQAAGGMGRPGVAIGARKGRVRDRGSRGT